MRNGGQGSICDFCKKEINPFETSRIIIRDLDKGKKYEKVSSDTIIRDKTMYHLCDNCKKKVLSILENMCE